MITSLTHFLNTGNMFHLEVGDHRRRLHCNHHPVTWVVYVSIKAKCLGKYVHSKRDGEHQWESKIWSIHGSDYEECRLLRYKNLVRTSQETYYVSATESSQLMLCKIWGFHSGDYEECRLLGYKNPVHTSQETHYVSATESSQLMLCKIWGFHGGDYEECHLLEYKNPVHTSQETHYVSATESSQLMLCKIWGFHGGDYEEWRLLGCYAIWLLKELTFWRNLAPPSSGWQESVRNNVSCN
jgi:hypothetical protein